MPALPNELTPQVQSYALASPVGVLATEVAGGPNRYRLDYARGLQQASVSLVLDATQLSIWNAFYYKLIAKGATPFTMPLDTGLGLASHSVQIVPGSHSISSMDSCWQVAFAVDTIASVYALSDAAVAAYGLSSTAMPDGLSPMLESYGLEDAGGVLRSEVDGGTASYALQYARGLPRFACQLLLTADQFATWSVWFHRLIAKGAYTFDMPLDSGFGMQTHAANIVPDSYSATRTGGIHTLVSFAVEAEPKAYDLSTADAQSLVDFYNLYGTGTSELLARIATFALVDSLVLHW